MYTNRYDKICHKVTNLNKQLKWPLFDNSRWVVIKISLQTYFNFIVLIQINYMSVTYFYPDLKSKFRIINLWASQPASRG